MSRPILFLFILTAIALFLLGVRVGNNVKDIDRQVNIKNNISPTVINTPTLAPISYKTYELSYCKETFTLSNLFEQTKSATDEIKFSHANQDIYISCNAKTIENYKKVFATQEADLTAQVNGVKTNLYQSPEGIGYIIKSNNNKNVLYSFPSPLLPLFTTK